MEMQRETAWRDIQRKEEQDKSFVSVGVLSRGQDVSEGIQSSQ